MNAPRSRLRMTSLRGVRPHRPRLTPMRERNQALVAIWGTVLVALVVLAAMNLDALPFVHPTADYHARFENADGLKHGDDVRVEGVSVGSVDSVTVDGDQVDVAFTVRKGLALGADSRASIEIATVLGTLFLQVESAGSGRLAAGSTIPIARTTPAYSLLGALDQFGEFSRNTELPTLQKSLQSLASTLDGVSSTDVRTALRGLTRVSTTLAAKQDDIARVLRSADAIVTTLDHNSGPLLALLSQGDEFLRLVESRHAVISRLLTDTATLGRELARLIARNGRQFGSLLADLDTVTGVLATQKAQLQRAVVVLGRFATNITNATGSGPFIDLLTPTAFVPDNQIKGCGVDPAAAQQKPCSP